MGQIFALEGGRSPGLGKPSRGRVACFFSATLGVGLSSGLFFRRDALAFADLAQLPCGVPGAPARGDVASEADLLQNDPTGGGLVFNVVSGVAPEAASAEAGAGG